MSEINRILFDSYRDLYRPYVNVVNNRLAKFNLFSTQWLVLRLISLKGSCTLAEIAKETRVEKPSVTRTIQKLIEIGYIETRQGEDRREKYVLLTERGTEVYEAIQLELSSLFEECIEGIQEEELHIARKVLDRILQNVLKR